MALVELRRERRAVALELERTVPQSEQVQAPDISTFMARVFGNPPKEAREAERSASSPRTFEIAFDVLKRGAEALEEAQLQCEKLQSEIASDREQAKVDLEEVRSARDEWQQLATAAAEKLEHTQRQLAEARRFAEAAQEGTDAATERAEVAERRASVMEKVATALHDDIVAAFGNYATARSAFVE